jgi:hypothetical protein
MLGICAYSSINTAITTPFAKAMPIASIATVVKFPPMSKSRAFVVGVMISKQKPIANHARAISIAQMAYVTALQMVFAVSKPVPVADAAQIIRYVENLPCVVTLAGLVSRSKTTVLRPLVLMPASVDWENLV